MKSLICEMETNLLHTLGKRFQKFYVSGDRVKVLASPTEFYQELNTRSKTARSRIVMSALYLGTGPKELNLVDALQKNPYKPRIKILLDYFRGTRKNPSDGMSSCEALKPLMGTSPARICLYQTPKLKGLLKKFAPQRYNETIGLQHIKAYVFDDSVIISGANLSEDYFMNRQDRYVVVEDCKGLADFFEDLIDVVSEFSYKLQSKGEFRWESSFTSFEENKSKFMTEFKSRLLDFLIKKRPSGKCSSSDTVIYPSIQAGTVDIFDDSEFTAELLKNMSSKGSVRFGTGYFNLTENYKEVLLKETGKTEFHILMAHPRANGFFGAKGLAGGIPHAYTLIASQFYNAILSNGDENRIQLHEYERKGWTFHGKGLWYHPNRKEDVIFTMIGSPNFGYRSVHRDLEAQIGILTNNSNLRARLTEEADRVFRTSKRVDRETFCKKDRSVPVWVHAFVRFARNFF